MYYKQNNKIWIVIYKSPLFKKKKKKKNKAQNLPHHSDHGAALLSFKIISNLIFFKYQLPYHFQKKKRKTQNDKSIKKKKKKLDVLLFPTSIQPMNDDPRSFNWSRSQGLHSMYLTLFLSYFSQIIGLYITFISFLPGRHVHPQLPGGFRAVLWQGKPLNSEAASPFHDS